MVDRVDRGDSGMAAFSIKLMLLELLGAGLTS